MNPGLLDTGLWHDVADLPAAMQRALDRHEGWDEAIDRLRAPELRRLVVSGNGASYYAGIAMWLASLAGPRDGLELICVPSGVLAGGGFAWRAGDAFMAVSSSGEFRDLVMTARSGSPPPEHLLVTGERDSSLAETAGPIASFDLPANRAITHTQDFCCGVLTVLALWAGATRDVGLERAVLEAPESCARSIALTIAWAEGHFGALEVPSGAIAFGHGPAWAAALEAALLLKEVPQILCEGLETREGATSAMTSLGPGLLALSLPSSHDPFVDEAERLCGGTGATVLRAVADPAADPRLSAIACFPASVALCAELALRNGRSVDAPVWIDAYLATARAV
jgi:fructoselysine-6-P-deglycase FrlB-like protein